MISLRTICLVYFALLFGTPHANCEKNASDILSSSITANTMPMTTDTDGTNTHQPTSNDDRGTLKQNSLPITNTQSFCTQPTPNKHKEGHCIFFLPTGKDTLLLIVAALTAGCLALLLTTLICACQVCHLRGIISILQTRYDNIDQHARRERSESPCRDGGQVDGQPTETCFMLSEVTAAQDESREDEENKTEEKNDTEQPSTESPVKDPNGDVTQENSPEPDAKAPESSDTGV